MVEDAAFGMKIGDCSQATVAAISGSNVFEQAAVAQQVQTARGMGRAKKFASSSRMRSALMPRIFGALA